jgi:hypothetical protein
LPDVELLAAEFIPATPWLLIFTRGGGTLLSQPAPARCQRDCHVD